MYIEEEDFDGNPTNLFISFIIWQQEAENDGDGRFDASSV
jgi:hypothetical protein